MLIVGYVFAIRSERMICREITATGRCRTAAIPHRVAQLLRLLANPDRAQTPRSVDTPKAAYVSLAAMEDRAKSLQGAAPRRRSKVPGCGCGGFADRVLAHVQERVGPDGTAQPCLRCSRAAPPLCCPLKLNPAEPPRYGPVCQVVWEGRRREASPYPDQLGISTIGGWGMLHLYLTAQGHWRSRSSSMWGAPYQDWHGSGLRQLI